MYCLPFYYILQRLNKFRSLHTSFGWYNAQIHEHPLPRKLCLDDMFNENVYDLGYRHARTISG